MCVSNGYNLYAHVNVGEKIEHILENLLRACKINYKILTHVKQNT